MKLIFHIEYRTRWGEELRVAGSIPSLGGFKPGQAFALSTADGLHWEGTLHVKECEGSGPVAYRYEVYENGRPTRVEYDGFPRLLCPGGPYPVTYRLMDHWQDIPPYRPTYTTAFIDAICAHPVRDSRTPCLEHSVIIRVLAPEIDADHQLCLCGQSAALGGWNTSLALPMNDVDFPVWQAEMDARGLAYPVEYKFVLREKTTGRLVAWEKGDNRRIDLTAHPGGTLVLSVDEPRFDVPPRRVAGVAVPVFSLRSEGSFGIGDFGDLCQLVDWAADTYQRVVQILPINDTTMTHAWTDSYPYNSISIYALHPLYLDMRQLPEPVNPDDARRLEQCRRRLNALPQMDYEAVDKAKWTYIRLAFEQEGAAVMSSNGFLQFKAANDDWLKPYTAYCCLRDAYGTPNFRNWPKYSVYNAQEVDGLRHCEGVDPREIDIHYYVQYKLHLQLKAVSEHARRRGVVLKGDIPIGISRNSVEAWTEPYYFHIDGQAGAPPDDFSVNGQNWGFPTYDWQTMERDGYAWWLKRFRKMAQYFSAYRIDHILGFFRIWEIPRHAVHGLLGQFSPALPMTRDEIESYGLTFRSDFFLKPYIHESFLNDLFGAQTEWVKQTFLAQDAGRPGLYHLRPAFDTQRKVQTYFAQQTDETSLVVRDGLYSLQSNVLFVVDHRMPERYHPRIAAMNSPLFQALSRAEQSAFIRLHEDYFYRRHNDFWYQQAMKKLPRLVEATRMLVCGEDLGMIPGCVPTVMRQLNILSLEIQSMPKEYGQTFGDPARYPYLSVCTISSHDTSTMRGWWQENTALTKRYYNEVLGHSGPAPAEATPALCEEIISSHLRGRSMLCILTLQDWMSLDGELRLPDAAAERINVPANPRHYWRYRMHLTLEQLACADVLNNKIRQLIADARRQ